MNIKKFATSAASVVTAGALIIGGTFAFFTDSDTSTGNTLGAGTLDIQLQDLMGNALEGPIFEVDEETGPYMFPGGPSVVRCAAVANNGSLNFNYTLTGAQTASTSPSLANVLWGKTYTWIGPGEPTSLTDCSDNSKWQLVTDPFVPTGELPVSLLLSQELPLGGLAAGNKAYYRWEYFLPEVLTIGFPDTEVVENQNAYQGASTTLTFEAKAYQTNDPAYPAP